MNSWISSSEGGRSVITNQAIGWFDEFDVLITGWSAFSG